MTNNFDSLDRMRERIHDEWCTTAVQIAMILAGTAIVCTIIVAG